MSVAFVPGMMVRLHGLVCNLAYLYGLVSHFAVSVHQLLSSGLLILMSFTTQYWELLVLLVIYNCNAEMFLVTVSTQLGLDLKEAILGPTVQPNDSSETESTKLVRNQSHRRYYRWLLFTFAGKYIASFVAEVRHCNHSAVQMRLNSTLILTVDHRLFYS